MKRLLLAMLSLVALVVFGVQGITSNADTGYGPGTGRPFGAAWLNQPIPANPTLDPNSAAVINNISVGAHIANLFAFGIPVYFADASTPVVSVSCREPWGTCPFTSARVPVNAKPHTGSDHAMVVVDLTNMNSYEFWDAAKVSSTSWSMGWGAVSPDVINGPAAPGGTGADLSRLAMLILEREIAAGEIPHALGFSSSYTCRALRYPATHSDGDGTGSGCIVYGSRVQLDPSINVDAIPNITPGEKAIAKALQRYGAYAMDSGGAPMAFAFELSPSATASAPISPTFRNAGFQWDYADMPHIPWNRLRVLSDWNGGGGSVPTSTTTTTSPVPTTTTTTTVPPTSTTAPTTTTTTTTPAGDRTKPTAPANLRATSTSFASISLAWDASTDNVGVTRYEVWRGNADYANWNRVYSGSSRSFKDTPWWWSTNTYRVVAIDAAGNVSDASNVIRVRAQ